MKSGEHRQIAEVMQARQRVPSGLLKTDTGQRLVRQLEENKDQIADLHHLVSDKHEQMTAWVTISLAFGFAMGVGVTLIFLFL